MTGEIRRTKSSGLYGGFAAALCCLAAWLILGREGGPLLVGVVFMVLYGIITDRNDRVLYDEYGIVLFTFWGKAVPYDWSRVEKVDTAVAAGSRTCPRRSGGQKLDVHPQHCCRLLRGCGCGGSF